MVCEGRVLAILSYPLQATRDQDQAPGSAAQAEARRPPLSPSRRASGQPGPPSPQPLREQEDGVAARHRAPMFKHYPSSGKLFHSPGRVTKPRRVRSRPSGRARHGGRSPLAPRPLTGSSGFSLPRSQETLRPRPAARRRHLLPLG